MNKVVEHYEDDEIPADWEFPDLPTAKKLDNEIVVTLKHVQKGIRINQPKGNQDLDLFSNFRNLTITAKKLGIIMPYKCLNFQAHFNSWRFY